ncbi:hypothetical protein JCM24511_08062 [Saitozyma sp. JCM 24511]|nr:hypothetical protein JCM24511_08062 [Saitozyma sp. JCM 24511]
MASNESDTKLNEPLDSVAELAANYNSSPNVQLSGRDGVEGKPCPGGPPRGPPRGPPPPEVLARKGMLALARNGAILFCVIWATGCWIYGSNDGAQYRVNRLKVLVNDFDGGAFGQALLTAVDSLNGNPTYPTFEQASALTAQDMSAEVFSGKYWASISANAGATSAFQNALNSTSAAAAYNSSAVYSVHVASARYFTSYQSYIYPAVLQVMGSAQQLASNQTVSAAIGMPSLSDARTGIIAHPVNYSLVDIAPLSFQARVFLNTFGIVVSHLSQFFFNMILNGIFLGVGIYRNTTFRSLIKRKYPVKVLWTLATSLTITSFPIIFDEGWSLPANSFFALWATEWVYAWINFNTVGVVLVFLPLPFVPMFIFPWIVTSITASLIPIELSNVFYRISYAYPSHAYWNTVITVYGRGIANVLHIYLPILAAWLVVTEVGWLLGDLTLAKRSTRPPPERR